MPFVTSSNNRITPANSRSADVAREALRDISAVQQSKYHNAFLVDSYEALIYHVLYSGEPCSCQAKGKALAKRMDVEGKLDRGQINKLITGGYEFKVNPYGSKPINTPQWVSETSTTDEPAKAPVRDTSMFEVLGSENQVVSPFDNIGLDDTNPSVSTIEPDGDVFGINGPIAKPETLDELMESQFDSDEFGMSDVSCPVCMGNGYIGGFVLDGGWRKVLVPEDTTAIYDGVIDTNERPLSVTYCTSAQWTVTLPRGAAILDVIRVWNHAKLVPTIVMIDTTPVTMESQVLSFCDGRPHTFSVFFSEPSEFTHVEIQLGLSREPSLIQFPRLNQGTDMSKLDSTDDVAICASPVVPLIRKKDIIAESSFGKVFQVESSQSWNDVQRRVLGWDMSARVVQPQELYNLLPKRRLIKQKTTVKARSNIGTE